MRKPERQSFSAPTAALPSGFVPWRKGAVKNPVSQIHLSERRYRFFRYFYLTQFRTEGYGEVAEPNRFTLFLELL